VDVTDWTESRRAQLLQYISTIEEQALGDLTSLAEAEPTGWSKTLVQDVKNSLHQSKALVQVKVIDAAIANGGIISREDVYRLGGYKKDRSLKGFTRPINRSMEALKNSGYMPEDAEPLLEPIYDPYGGWQKAQGFRVPPEVVRLYAD
jgi:hypothetical protein